MERLRNPQLQGLVFFILTGIIYLFLARPTSPVTDFQLVGNLAYISTGASGFRIARLPSSDSPKPWKLEQISGYDTYGYAHGLEVKDKYIFIADEGIGLAIFQYPDPDNPKRVKFLATQETPGKALDVALIEDQALVACDRAGIILVNVKEPTAPKRVEDFLIPGEVSRFTLKKNRLFAAFNGQVLKIFDVSELKRPKELGSFKLPSEILEINVDDSLSNAYVSLGENGLWILDILDPTKITKKHNFDTPGEASSFTVSGQYGYLADGSRGLMVIEINSPTEMRRWGTFDTLDNVSKVVVREEKIYLADGHEGLRVLDLYPKLESKVQVRSPRAQLFDVARYKNYTFLAMGERGLRILQGKPGQFQEVAFFDTYGSARRVVIQNDRIYVADEKGGLIIFNGTEIKHPLKYLGQVSDPKVEEAQDVEIVGNLAFIATGPDGLEVWDNSDPVTPLERGQLRIPGNAVGITILGNRAYIAAEESGLHILDVTDPRRPARLSTTPIEGKAHSVNVFTFNDRLARAQGKDPYNADPALPDTHTYAVISAGSGGLQIIEVTNPRQPVHLATLGDFPGSVQKVVLRRDLAFVVDDGGRLTLVGLANPAKPLVLRSLVFNEKLTGLTVDVDYVYVTAGENGLRVIDLVKLGQQPLIGSYQVPATIYQFSQVEKMAISIGGYTASQVDGQTIFSGDLPGISVWDISDGKIFREIGHLRLPGWPRHVALYGTPALVSSGMSGLYAVDISGTENIALQGTIKPSAPTPVDVRSTLVKDSWAYVANGAGGLWVVDLTDLAKLKEVNKIQPPFPATITQFVLLGDQGEYLIGAASEGGVVAFWLHEPKVPQYISAFQEYQDIRGLALWGNLALVAAGKDGLVVLDVSRPAAMTQIAHVATASPALAIEVQENYAFVSLQDQDMVVYDLLNLTQSVEVGKVPDLGEARQVTVQSLAPDPKGFKNFQLLFVKRAGELVNNRSTQEAKFDLYGTFTTPGTASFSSVLNEVGLFFDENLNRMGKSAPTLQNLHKKLKEASDRYVRLITHQPWPDVGHSRKAQQTLRQVFVDAAVIGLFSFFAWMVLMVQYVLPVHGVGKRVSASFRLLFYFLERHGVAARVRDAVVFQLENNRNRRGPGVVQVDLNSAVILAKQPLAYILPLRLLYQALSNLTGSRSPFGRDRQGKPVPPLRVVGPGLVFTVGKNFPSYPLYDEVILGAVDLRNQVRTQIEVVASTREGIEFQTNVFCIFTVGQPADILYVTYDSLCEQRNWQDLRVVKLSRGKVEKVGGALRWRNVVERLTDELDEADRREIHEYLTRTPRPDSSDLPHDDQPQPFRPPYVVDPVRIFAAFAAEALTGQNGLFDDWRELPAKTAVEVFRDMLAEQRYDTLYRPTDPESFPLQDFKNQLGWTVRNLGVLSFQYVERLDGRVLKADDEWRVNNLFFYPPQPLRNPKILRTRGIKVIRSGFTEMRPVQAQVRAQQLATWRARWQRISQVQESDLELQAMRIRTEARLAAQQDLANILARLYQETPPTRAALAVRIMQALEGAATDPQTRRLLPADTISMLKELKEWIE